MTKRSEIELLTLLNGVHLSFSHLVFGAAQIHKYHSCHPVNRLLFILKEEENLESYIADRGAGTHFFMRKGYLYFMPAFRDLEVHQTREMNYLSCHFNFDVFYGAELFQEQPLREFPAEEMTEKVLECMQNMQMENGIEGACGLRSLLYGLIGRVVAELDTEVLAHLSRWRDYRELIAHILARISAETTVDELADFAGMRRDVFSRKFSADIGMPPKKFLMRILLRRASERLLTPGIRVKEVAQELKFLNEFYFSRFFKTHTGMSPRAFRELYCKR